MTHMQHITRKRFNQFVKTIRQHFYVEFATCVDKGVYIEIVYYANRAMQSRTSDANHKLTRKRANVQTFNLMYAYDRRQYVAGHSHLCRIASIRRLINELKIDQIEQFI